MEEPVETSEEERIPRTSTLSRHWSGLKAKLPKYTSKFPRIAHPFSRPKRDMSTLEGCLIDNSKTFAIALAMMNDHPDVMAARRDLVVGHQAFKVIDFIDEKEGTLDQYKAKLMADFLETIRHPDDSRENIRDISARLVNLGFNEKDEEHKSLIYRIPTLINAFDNRSNKARSIFLEYGTKMAEGFARVRNKREIKDFGDVDRDCLIAAGYVGYLVNDTYESRGIITPDLATELKNPAKIVGKAVQLGNNLRDLFKDPKNGIKHWPDNKMKVILEATSIPNLKERKAAIEEVYVREFKDLIEYAIPVFEASAEYPDNLPIDECEDHRNFAAIGPVLYSLVVRNLDNEEFLMTQGKYPKPTKGEIFDAIDVVRGLVRQGESIKPYLQHILRKREPSKTYRN